MSVSIGQVQIGQQATLIVPINSTRTNLTVYNPVTSPNPVFIGKAGVTPVTGYQLDPGQKWGIGAETDAYYGILATGEKLGAYFPIVQPGGTVDVSFCDQG